MSQSNYFPCYKQHLSMRNVVAPVAIRGDLLSGRSPIGREKEVMKSPHQRSTRSLRPCSAPAQQRLYCNRAPGVKYHSIKARMLAFKHQDTIRMSKLRMVSAGNLATIKMLAHISNGSLARSSQVSCGDGVQCRACAIRMVPL